MTSTNRLTTHCGFQVAGILTADGYIAWSTIQTLDTLIFALIEQHERTWGTYNSLHVKRRKTREEDQARDQCFRLAQHLRARLAQTSARTIEGARAKADSAIRSMTSGRYPNGEAATALAISALRDACRGPTLQAASAIPASCVVDLGDYRASRADADLIAKLVELETAHKDARLDELRAGYNGTDWPPTRVVAADRWIVLQEEIAEVPASTMAGIIGKLDAAGKIALRDSAFDLLRSAVHDMRVMLGAIFIVAGHVGMAESSPTVTVPADTGSVASVLP